MRRHHLVRHNCLGRIWTQRESVCFPSPTHGSLRPRIYSSTEMSMHTFVKRGSNSEWRGGAVVIHVWHCVKCPTLHAFTNFVDSFLPISPTSSRQSSWVETRRHARALSTRLLACSRVCYCSSPSGLVGNLNFAWKKSSKKRSLKSNIDVWKGLLLYGWVIWAPT